MDMPMIEGAGPVPANTQAPGNGYLGKDEFLLLLTTQMRHQDPLEPMDSTAMIAQLAQFSSLEQMQNLNEAFTEGRREQGLMQSMLLEGQTLNITLDSGRQVYGMVDRVSWIDTEGVTLNIAGELVPMREIASMSLAGPLPEAGNGETKGVETEGDE
jgi:flagellar basal-body rod modification protein FlgD